MGNIHRVIQVEPYLSAVGAVIDIRDGQCEHVARAFPPDVRYAGLAGARRFVETAEGIGYQLPVSGRAFVAIKTGGKGDYDDVRELVTAAAPHLHDALFYLDDEYCGFVDRWELRDGALTVARVVDADSSVACHLVSAGGPCAEFAYNIMLDEITNGYFCDVDDFTIDAMTAYAPDSWPTWYIRARMLLDAGRIGEVNGWAVRCLDQVPQGSRAHADILYLLVEALSLNDLTAALRLAGTAVPLWTRHSMLYALETTVALALLCGDEPAARDASIARLSADSSSNIDRALDDLGRLYLLRGERDKGLACLRVAHAINPSIGSRQGRA